MNRVKFQNIMYLFRETFMQNKKNILICLLNYFCLYVLSIGSVQIENAIFSLFVIILTIVINCGVITAIKNCSYKKVNLRYVDIFTLGKDKLKLGAFWYILIAFLTSILGVVLSLIPTPMLATSSYIGGILLNSMLTPLMIISIADITVVNRKNYVYVIILMVFIFWINLLPHVGEFLNFLIIPLLSLYLVSLSEAERKTLNN